MEEKLNQYQIRMNILMAEEKLSPEVQGLLEELLADLTEAARSNKALRRAALKAGQSSMMSSRLRDALQE
ncbi:Ni2+-binding GTPase [Paenibacillus sp. BR2-3]|uniref:hypothetical protein n=1 Tax=Paenibacillus sp. BR2-3 TaxID=3048494 RepID=UPI0039779D92